MMPDVEKILNEAREILEEAREIKNLDLAKSRIFGKSSSLNKAMKQLKQSSPNERRSLGETINNLKKDLEGMLDARRQFLINKGLTDELASSKLDVTMPGRRRSNLGSLHPVTRTLERVTGIFNSMAFEVADGPEIETDYYNFTALNQPENHPARSMHDTFYLEDDRYLLRTHTSPMQVRYMESHKPPIRIISPGRVYRVDSDATHSPMFHQLEGLWVDDRVSFSNLKGVIREFLRVFFDSDAIEVRFRPSYFPFTEPSAEIDMSFGDSWLEIGGCGMVHPAVLQNVKINSSELQAFAFGMGLDRLTMLRYGVKDLRLFFDGDVRFLRQFR